jgi:hypothetical protein
LLFYYIHKGNGDASENSERVVDGSLQIRFIACSYKIPLAIYKRVVDSLLKCFSQAMETLLKGYASGFHHCFDSSPAIARQLGEY